MKARGDDITEALERDGYAVVREVFSADEIARMRDEVTALLATKARPINGGLCNGPGINAPVPRESDLARRLLDDARLASPCDGELPCQIYVHADTYNDWHVDFGHSIRLPVLRGASAWMYKIAIYLQDHPDRDGLSLVPGSHKEGNTPGTPLHLGTRVGDIVVFNHRVRHAGRLPNSGERVIATFADCLYRLRLINEMVRQRLQRLFRRLELLLQPSPTAERIAIFLYFAPYHEICQRYAALSHYRVPGSRPESVRASLRRMAAGCPIPTSSSSAGHARTGAKTHDSYGSVYS